MYNNASSAVGTSGDGKGANKSPRLGRLRGVSPPSREQKHNNWANSNSASGVGNNTSATGNTTQLPLNNFQVGSFANAVASAGGLMNTTGMPDDVHRLMSSPQKAATGFGATTTQYPFPQRGG